VGRSPSVTSAIPTFGVPPPLPASGRLKSETSRALDEICSSPTVTRLEAPLGYSSAAVMSALSSLVWSPSASKLKRYVPLSLTTFEISPGTLPSRSNPERIVSGAMPYTPGVVGHCFVSQRRSARPERTLRRSATAPRSPCCAKAAMPAASASRSASRVVATGVPGVSSYCATWASSWAISASPSGVPGS